MRASIEEALTGEEAAYIANQTNLLSANEDPAGHERS